MAAPGGGRGRLDGRLLCVSRESVFTACRNSAACVIVSPAERPTVSVRILMKHKQRLFTPDALLLRRRRGGWCLLWTLPPFTTCNYKLAAARFNEQFSPRNLRSDAVNFS